MHLGGSSSPLHSTRILSALATEPSMLALLSLEGVSGTGIRHSLGMGNVTVIAIIVGVMLFGLLAVIVFLEEKVPLLKDSKIFNVVKEAVIALMLLCVPVVIVSVLVHWANQPSG